MAGSGGPEHGVEVQCPSCGQTVLQKAMIPVLVEGAKGYLCRECARARIEHSEAAASAPA